MKSIILRSGDTKMEVTPADIIAINRFKEEACRKKTNSEIENYDNVIQVIRSTLHKSFYKSEKKSWKVLGIFKRHVVNGSVNKPCPSENLCHVNVSQNLSEIIVEIVFVDEVVNRQKHLKRIMKTLSRLVIFGRERRSTVVICTIGEIQQRSYHHTFIPSHEL